MQKSMGKPGGGLPELLAATKIMVFIRCNGRESFCEDLGEGDTEEE